MSAVAPDVMELLKSETAEQHRSAEQHPFQRRLASGQVTRDELRRWLSQLLEVHAVLESHLDELRSTDKRVRAIVQDEQFQQPYLEQDLEAIEDENSSLEPATETFHLIEQIEEAAATCPLRLLGMHYVLEGSNNGSRFLAKNLSRSLGLTPDRGLRYMDPYGERQPELWQQFKTTMRAQSFNPAEVEALLEGARQMFDGISRISGAMQNRSNRVAPAQS